MTRWEQAWTSDVLAAFLLEGAPGLNTEPGEVDYLSAFARMRRGSTRLAAVGLRAAIWLVALAPLWLLGRLAIFSGLGRPERTELLMRLLGHRSLLVRELTALLKLVAAMALLGTTSVRARSSYDPHPPLSAAAEHEHTPLTRSGPVRKSAAQRHLPVWAAAKRGHARGA